MKKRWLLILIMIMFIATINDANAGWGDKWNNLKNKAKNTTERVRSGTQKAREKSRNFSERVKKKVSGTKKKWDSGRDKRKKIYNSVKKQYNRTLNKIRNPETRRKAIATISTVVEIRQKIKDAKRRGTEKVFNSFAEIPINGTTLGEIASKKLSRKFPNLGRTGLFDDPAEAATALVCHDSHFFLNEVGILQKDGRNISVYGAIRESSSFDADKTIKYLRIAGAVESVASADDVGGAMIGVFNAIDATNR